MANLDVRQRQLRPLPLQRSRPLHQRSSSPPPFIEISDDEDDYVPTPKKHRIPTPSSPEPGRRRTRRPLRPLCNSGANHSEPLSISDSSGESDADLTTRQQPRKRAKLHRIFTSARLSIESISHEADRNDGKGETPASREDGRIHVDPSGRHLRNDDLIEEVHPWYFDTKTGIKMYRGPGYEQFPVALGTIEGHQEHCDAFEQSRKVKPKTTTPKQTPLDLLQERALPAILEVLTDISHDFVKLEIARIAHLNPGVDPSKILTDTILGHILELEEYPKQATESRKPKAVPAADGTGVTIPINQASRHDPRYSRYGRILLAWHFLHVPLHHIDSIIRSHPTIFDAFVLIHRQESKHFQVSSAERQYRRMQKPRQTIEKKYQLGPNEWRDIDNYGFWVNELQAAKQHVERESIKNTKEEEKAAEEESNLQHHRKIGALVCCQICFDDDTPMNRTVTCEAEAGHFFCYTCISQLADTQVGMLKYEMQCQHGDGCAAQLDMEGMGRAVPLKVLDRLAFNQQQAEIAAAGLDGLEQCPFCDFQAVVDAGDEVTVFNCLHPDCGRASCRKCKEDAHIPKTCEEHKDERGLSARHAVEEARSESVMRQCPKCKVKIMKEFGCNKMTCTQCHCLMCYICKADITKAGYEHFNTGSTKCALYDNDTAGLHDKEADAAELEAIKKAKAKDADLDEKKLQIETGKPKARPAAAQPAVPRRPHVMPGYFGAVPNPAAFNAGLGGQGWDRVNGYMAQDAHADPDRFLDMYEHFDGRLNELRRRHEERVAAREQANQAQAAQAPPPIANHARQQVAAQGLPALALPAFPDYPVGDAIPFDAPRVPVLPLFPQPPPRAPRYNNAVAGDRPVAPPPPQRVPQPVQVQPANGGDVADYLHGGGGAGRGGYIDRIGGWLRGL